MASVNHHNRDRIKTRFQTIVAPRVPSFVIEEEGAEEDNDRSSVEMSGRRSSAFDNGEARHTPMRKVAPEPSITNCWGMFQDAYLKQMEYIVRNQTAIDSVDEINNIPEEKVMRMTLTERKRYEFHLRQLIRIEVHAEIPFWHYFTRRTIKAERMAVITSLIDEYNTKKTIDDRIHTIETQIGELELVCDDIQEAVLNLMKKKNNNKPIKDKKQMMAIVSRSERLKGDRENLKFHMSELRQLRSQKSRMLNAQRAISYNIERWRRLLKNMANGPISEKDYKAQQTAIQRAQERNLDILEGRYEFAQDSIDIARDETRLNDDIVNTTVRAHQEMTSANAGAGGETDIDPFEAMFFGEESEDEEVEENTPRQTRQPQRDNGTGTGLPRVRFVTLDDEGHEEMDEEEEEETGTRNAEGVSLLNGDNRETAAVGV